MKKRIVTYLRFIFVVLLAGVLTGCGFFSSEKYDPDKKTINTSIYPVHFLTQELAQGIEKVQVKRMGSNKGEHDFTVSIGGLMSLYSSHLMVLYGEGFEERLQELVEAIKKEKPEVILEVGADDSLFDPKLERKGAHTWLKVQNLIKMTETIRNKLQEIDSKNSSKYQENAEKIIARLQGYQKQIEEVAKQNKKKTLFFLNSGFAYLVGQFGVEQIVDTQVTEHNEPSLQLQKEVFQKAQEAKATGVFYEAHGEAEVDQKYESLIKENKFTPRKVYVLEEETDGLNLFQMIEANIKTMTEELRSK